MRLRSLTVKLAALEQNIDLFVSYLTSSRNHDGGITKAGSYLGIWLSFTYLFRKYRYTVFCELKAKLKEYVEGVKRYASCANQHGEGIFYDGDRGSTATTWYLRAIQQVVLC